MGGPLSKYAFINANQLEKAPSMDEALALLRDTPFAGLEEVYSATGDLRQAELELLKNEIELYRDIKQHLHHNSVGLVDALLTGFEIENLKNSIRIYFDRKIRNRSVEAGIHYILYDHIVHQIPIDIILNADSFDEIAGVCEGTPYSQIIKKYYHTVESEGSLFRMDGGIET